MPSDEPETNYLRQLKMRVEQVLERFRVNPEDLREAHTWLRKIAACLRYPPADDTPEPALTSAQVKEEMDELRQSFQPDLKRKRAQAALYGAWQRTWEDYGPDLLPCYDIPGLPPDNLMLESLFGRLRRHQRRVSGRKSTRELRDFGQYQVLFLAESEAELLEHIRQVSPEEYLENRKQLEEAEAPRRLLHRLHRDPLGTMRSLIKEHATRRATLLSPGDKPPPQPGGYLVSQGRIPPYLGDSPPVPKEPAISCQTGLASGVSGRNSGISISKSISVAHTILFSMTHYSRKQTRGGVSPDETPPR